MARQTGKTTQVRPVPPSLPGNTRFDRRSPVRGVVLKDPNTGKDYSLGVLNVSKLVKSVEVIQSDTAKDSSSTVVLHDPDGSLASSGLLKEGILFRVFMGYDTIVEDFGEWVAKEVESTFPADGDQSFTIKGQTKAITFAQSESSESFKGMTDKQIVELIAIRYGLKVEKNGQSTVDNPGIMYEEVMRGAQSEAEFLRERARLYGYEFYVDDEVLHFHKPLFDDLPFVLKYRSEIPGESNIIEASIKTKVTKKNRTSSKKGVDVKKGKEVNENAESDEGPNDAWETKSEAKRKADGQVVTNPEPLAEDSVVRRSHEGDESSEIIRKMAKATEAKERWTVELDIKTIGNPLIRRGKTITVKGIGNRYDGSYYIKEARHLFGDTGYLTSFLGKTPQVGKGKTPKAPKDTGIRMFFDVKSGGYVTVSA